MTFFAKSIKIRVLKSKKSSRDTLLTPLECHVIFKWPLNAQLFIYDQFLLIFALKCDEGFVIDEINGVCYKALSSILAYDEAFSGSNGCSLYNSDITMLYDDIHANGLLRLLNRGEIVLNLG